ncbi:outer membrane protein assembly factor BamE [Nitrosomonas sp. Is37]|uniref:outer membrane protein assembly factor BamE n=1 Tax=Nitrosomonas sp. Is37 TaxID=3080535 RepID=UPI00294A9EE1|nr:outer membrane protein assembly factor BamE [Nitrosomonas sp. Is37]MDV6345152.1 outer membrane protein assembly factor BamE [Nitrosomonas sp. Is37]
MKTLALSMHLKILLLLVSSLLFSCAYIPTLPYKIDIQQGNVVTQEMVEKLKPGMTRSQVRFVLGTPLITDVFHNNRWDYFYYFAPRGVLSEKRKLTVIFDGDRLSHIEGDFSLSTFSDNLLQAPLRTNEERPQYLKEDQDESNKDPND